MAVVISFDIEPDLHTKKYKGITEGISTILKMLDKYKIKATFFVTCDCLEKYPKVFKNLQKQGHEIALHAYRHTRFDDLSDEEKERHLKKSIILFRKILKKHPNGFRAPQFSIDEKTLDLLEKHKFKYDSSIAAADIFQLLFHKRFSHWFKQFFTSVRKYKIRKNLYEIPPTSLFIPFTSLNIRLFPQLFIKVQYLILRILYSNIVFYAHSWDFISLKKSRIMELCPKKDFIKKFNLFLKYLYKRDKFTTMIDLVK